MFVDALYINQSTFLNTTKSLVMLFEKSNSTEFIFMLYRILDF